MFLLSNNTLLNSNKINRFESADFFIYWQGFIYIDNHQNGLESVKIFSTRFSENSLETAFNLLKGVYFLSIFDKRKKNYYSVIDNSGLYKAFYTTKYISLSFLELIKLKRMQINDIDKKSLIEFIHHGFIYSGKTFFNDIKKIDANEILISTEKKVSVLKKSLSNNLSFQTSDMHFFQNQYKYFFKSAKNEKLFLDSTGGADSRINIAVAENAKVIYDLSISGIPKNKDIFIAKEISKTIKSKLYIVFHNVNKNSLLVELQNIFLKSGGLFNVLSYHRLWQYQHLRKQKGCTLAVSGLGGELFKNFWWRQDFPFFGRKKSNLTKLFYLRFHPKKFLHSIFSEKLFKLSEKSERDIIDEWKSYILESNIKTYDNIYYNFKMKEVAGEFLTISNKFFKTYAPLLERTLFILSMNLPKRKRLFYEFHREIITNNSKELAKIKTDNGISLSLNPFYKYPDYFIIFINNFKKLFRIIIQRLFNIRIFQDNPNNPELIKILQKNKNILGMMELLKEEKIIRNDVDFSSLDFYYFGNLLTVSFLITYLKNGYKL